MTILVPLEIKVREINSRTFLISKIIDSTNFDVVIGEKSKVYNLFKHNDGMYLLSKGGPKPNFQFPKKNYKKNYIGIVDEEGPIMNMDNNEIRTRLHDHIIRNIDDYFFWGDRDLFTSKKYFKKHTCKINNFGHPKFDICKKENIKFYKREIKNIKKKYNKFIFIPLSHNADQILDKKNYTIHSYNIKKNLNKTKEKYKEFLNNDKKNYIKLINFTEKLAEKKPNLNIIVRPHPRQNINLVKKSFKKNLPNIKVIYEGVITPWIESCELYIHSGCTSFLEAASLEKKIIYVCENEDYKSSKMFKSYGYHFTSYNKCLTFLLKKIDKKNFHLDRSSKPTSIISNTKNKKYFYKEFIKFIKKKYNNKLRPMKRAYPKKTKIENYFGMFKVVVKKFILKVPIFRQIIFFINPSLLLTKEYKRKKFPSLERLELKSYLNRITTKKFNIKKLSDNLFLIKKINF
tara:strand:- start:1031 stop:2407 length:1377 start_codon:yes stop_codon:yes gene_type:complete